MIFVFLVLSLLIISACSQIDLSKVSEEDIDKLIKCDKPYIRFASGCCLDTNENDICDNDEITKDSNLKDNNNESDSNQDLGEDPNANVVFFDPTKEGSQLEINENDFIRINFHDKMYGIKLEEIDNKGLLISVRDLETNEEINFRINKGGSSTLIPLEPTNGDSFDYYIEARLDSINTPYNSAKFTFTKYENDYGCKSDSDCPANERCYYSEYMMGNNGGFCDGIVKNYNITFTCWTDKDCDLDSYCHYSASNLFTMCTNK